MIGNKRGALLLILIFGFAIRLISLSDRSLWTDEFFTLFQSTGHGVDIAGLLTGLSAEKKPEFLKARDFKRYLKIEPQRGLGDVSSSLIRTDTHPPLYFWIMHLWLKTFGESVFVLRFFSLLMGVFAIGLAYLLGKHLFGKDAAIFSALFASASAFSIRYSQEARVYGLILVLGLLSSILILRFEKSGKNSDALLFCFITSFGFYSHYFYSFVSIAQFAYFSIIHARDTVKLRKFYLAFLGSLLLFIPWFRQVALKGYNFCNAEWVFGYPGFMNKVYYALSGAGHFIFIFDKPTVLGRAIFFAGLLILNHIVFCAVRNKEVRFTRELLFCFLLFLIPLMGMLVIDILQHGALLRQERFWLFSFLGFIPIMGYFLNYGFSKKRALTALFAILMVSSSFMSLKAQFGPAPKYVSEWINGRSSDKRSAVIVYNIRSVVFAQAYYLDDDIYLLPVSRARDLSFALEAACGYANRIFLVRHFHWSDPSLMDCPFMAAVQIGPEFQLKASFKRDDISVKEYVKCGL